MPGCLAIIGRLIVNTILAKLVEEFFKRVTGDQILAWIAAILALFGISIGPRIFRADRSANRLRK